MALASDFLGPSELGSNLLEHRGCILPPWNLLGFSVVDFFLGWILPFLGLPGLDSSFWGFLVLIRGWILG